MNGLWPILLTAGLAAQAFPYDTKVNLKQPKVMVAEDLGPATIDVSAYPADLQKTYRDVFVPVFGFLGGTARAVNSPIIELDPELEPTERRNDPELFQNLELAQVSRDGWKKRVEEIMRRPACCGACPVLTKEKAKALRRFLVYDSIQRKTGKNAKAWLELRKDLLRRFQERQAGGVAMNQPQNTLVQENAR